MTDRWRGFAVTLDHAMRDDDAQSTLEAIRHIKGVLSVEPVVDDIGQQMAEQRARVKMRSMVYDALENF